MQSNVLGSITNRCIDDRAGQCEILSFVVYREQVYLGDESWTTLSILHKSWKANKWLCFVHIFSSQNSKFTCINKHIHSMLFFNTIQRVGRVQAIPYKEGCCSISGLSMITPFVYNYWSNCVFYWLCWNDFHSWIRPGVAKSNDPNIEQQIRNKENSIEQVWLTVKCCFTAQYILKFCIMINYDWRPISLWCINVCASLICMCCSWDTPLQEG